ncbi:MAG: glycosyltransferase family 2 protein [Phycisphaerales bacterium]
MTQHARAIPSASQRHPATAALTTPAIAVVMVTWNRTAEARRAIESVLSQHGIDLGTVHLVVIDNASTDGTTQALTRWLSPERTIVNETARAHEPVFATTATDKTNSAGLASVTLVRNMENLGGTGGFNTGFQVVERVLATHTNIDFLWLLDDDAEADHNALASLLATADGDPNAGLIGSRAVDIADRRTTYETTIYYDQHRGRMGETPHAGHRLEADHRAWVEGVGDTRGDRAFTGVREVDVVSACSMLARWSVVRGVGYWDSRYFIYCDDADWCLRVGRAGHRVVCDLDAVVYHTPWFRKLTPTRRYYAERNAIWTMRKGLSGRALRRSTAEWMRSILRESLAAGLRRRRFQAEILRRTALDAATNHQGKLDHTEPPHEELESAINRLGLNRPDAHIVVLCCTPEQHELAGSILAQLQDGHGQPSITVISRDGSGPGDIIYHPSMRSRLSSQSKLLLRPPDACIVFDSHNDFPLLRCPPTIHIDRRTPDQCQIERDGIRGRLAFFARWTATAFRATWYCLRSPKQQPKAPFG